MKTSRPLILALLCAASMAAAPAMAGFEWRAPDGARVTPTGSQAPVALVPEVGGVTREKLDLLSPAPASFKEGISSPPEFAEAPPVGIQYKNLMKSESAPATRMGISPPPEAVRADAAPAASQTQLVAGFGNGLPLGMALNQILPADYSFSLSQGVDGTQPVSWEGGKEWQFVLADMLDGAGLESRIKDKKVTVLREAGAPVPVKIVAPEPAPINLPPLHAEPQMSMAPKEIAAIPTIATPSVPAMPAAPASDIGRRDVWTGLAGQNLKTVLMAWSDRVNVKLVWNNAYDFAVPATFSRTTGYSDAVTQLLDTYTASKDPRAPKGRLYQGQAGEPAVLVIN